MAKTKKYHLNTSTGKVSICEASVKSCPLGEDNHFATEQEARNSFENSMNNELFQGLKKTDASESARIEELATIRENIQELTSQLNDRDKELKSSVKADKNFAGSEEWFDAVQQRKNTAYNIEFNKTREQELMNAVEREDFIKDANKVGFREHAKNILQSADGDTLTVYHFDGENTSFVTGEVVLVKDQSAILLDDDDNEHTIEYRNIITSRIKKQSDKPYNYHPAIEGKIHTNNANTILQSAYGMDEKTIKQEIQNRKNNGMTQTEAYRDLWANSKFRNDKSFVALDLETAAIRTQQVDTGGYSTIIEVGYVKLEGDNVEHNSELYGVPNNLLVSHGTGAENIHGISKDMVEGKQEFVNNEEHQKKVLEDLKGNVLIAHNAKFEINQLSHNLRGFKKAYDNGEIEVLDTMKVSQYFLPEADNNTNENFVKATGGEYVNSHRAHSDALMSLNALRRLKKLPEIAD